MGKVEYLWLIKEWIPYLNRTELAIASYIHGFAKISRVCWANNKQIAEHLGLTTTQISRNLKSLMRRGWLQEFSMESEEEDGIATAYDSEQQTLPLKRSKGIHRVITPFGDAPIFAQTSTAKNDTERVHEHLLQQANSLLHIEQLHSEQLQSETDHVPPLHFELDHDALEGSNTPVVFNTMNGLQAFVEAHNRVSLTKLHSEYRELHSETEKLRIEIRKLQTEVQKLQSEVGKLQTETPIYTSLIPIQDKFTNSSTTLSSTAPKPNERDSRIDSASLSKNASGKTYYRQDSPLAPPQRPKRYSVPEEELTGSKHFAAAKELLEWIRWEQPDIMWHFERDVQFTGAAPDEKRSRDEMLVCTIKLLELPCVQGDVEFVKELLTKAVSNNFWKDHRNCLTPHRLLDDHDEHTKITKLEFLATKLTTQSQRVTAQKQEQQKQEISHMTAESFEEHVKKIEKARKVEIERQRQAFLASL